MASDPGFAATPQNGAGLIPGTADTSLAAPANATTILTAGASGTKIEELRFMGVGTTVAGLVNVFAYDGSTYHLVDQVTVGAATPSTTAVSWFTLRTYSNLWLKSGWSLRVTGTVAGNQALVKVVAFAGDL